MIARRPAEDVNRWQQWAKSFYHECQDCYIKRTEKKERQANQENALWSRDIGLPKLKGEREDVTWANDLRRTVVATWLEQRDKTRKNYEEALLQAAKDPSRVAVNKVKGYKTLLDNWEGFIRHYALEGSTSPQWWMRHRDAFYPSSAFDQLSLEYRKLRDANIGQQG